jgi:hypothetical protein
VGGVPWPTGGYLSRQTSGPLEHGPGMPEGCGLHRPIGWGLACSTCYSFSILWPGEAFHELGVQSADVSALPGALPQLIVSPASQKSPWIMEVRRSVAVSWSPSCILMVLC